MPTLSVESWSDARKLARIGAWGIITTRPEAMWKALEEA